MCLGDILIYSSFNNRLLVRCHELQLAPLGKYYDCLEDPTYKEQISTYLGGMTVDEAMAACQKALSK